MGKKSRCAGSLGTESSQDTMVWPEATRNISQHLNSILSFPDHLPSKQDKINSLVVCDTICLDFKRFHEYFLKNKKLEDEIIENKTFLHPPIRS